MPWSRIPSRLLGACLLVAVFLPILAVGPAALLDRGPDGSARISLFPLALALFDPFVGICVRNSVLVASASAVGSLILGVGLGSVAGGGGSRIRGVLWVLALGPMAAGPLLIAPAIAWAIGGQGGWDWLAGRTTLGVSSEIVVRWLSLVWTGLACGTPLVALATVAGLRRVDPAWLESARAVGASPSRVWRDVAWPVLRPGVARASSLVFTLNLVEPAGPIVFGLRRTLAAQIVQASSRSDQPTRASTLALLAIGIAVMGRMLIHGWGGPSHGRVDHRESEPKPSESVRRKAASSLVLLTWSGLMIGPLVHWIWQALQADLTITADSWYGLLEGWWNDPTLNAWAGNSVATAGLGVAFTMTILRALEVRRDASTGRLLRAISRIFEAVPPLAVGVGALATPWLVGLLADGLGSSTGVWLRSIERELSPGRSPGFLLALALAGGQLPMLVAAAEAARGRLRPNRVEAARIMGWSERRAARAGEGGWLGAAPVIPAFLAFTMASTALGPALLLTPTSERRTLAPAILDLVTHHEGVDPQAVGPIALLLGLNLLGFGVVSLGRFGRRDG